MLNIFYRDRRLFALAILMIISAGLSALLTIGRQEDPTITNLFATIVTPYPGADPARVEALVTEKIEEQLREIPEIDDITSTSRSGISVVRVELSQFITDTQIEQTWSEIRDALSDAARFFPAGVPEPEFDDNRTGAFTAISAVLPAEGRSPAPAVMRRYAEILQDRLRGVSGTKFVQLFGDRTEEITIEVDLRKLSSLGLTVDRVSTAIANADAKVQAGQVRGQSADLLIEVEGEFKSLDRIGQIPIVDSADGRIVRVRDVASVSRGLQEPARALAYVDGRPAVLIAARMNDDLQVDAWANRIRTALAEFEMTLPAGLEHKLLFDQSVYTAERLQGVLQNMGIGAAIVVVVLMITLGWRAAFVVATILPLASLISLVGLQVTGIPIHQMSVTGLIVALGLLVDAGIVMTDDIRRRLLAGEARADAVAHAVKRLAVPLLASTITTVLAFMPMALLPGPAGDFVGAIAISVIIMLFASLGLALTITPALAGWMLKPRTPVNTEGTQTGSFFSGSLSLALHHPRLAILAALVPPIVGFGSFPTLKPQFFPGVDRNQFHVQVKLPDGSSIAETDAIARRAAKILQRQDGVTGVSWVVGESAPSFYYNMTPDRDNESSFSELLVTTTSPVATEDILPSVQRAFDREMPQAQVTVRGLVQGPPVAAPVEIRIVGPDLTTLRKLGDQVRSLMTEVPDVLQARTQLAPGAAKVSVDLNEEKVRLAGLELAAVARQLETSLEGATGGSIIEGSEELPVRVRVGADGRTSVDAVRRIDVIGTAPVDGDLAYRGIPLTALGKIHLVPAETPIYRRNGERINTIQGFVHRSVLPEAALRKVQDRIAASDLALPPGYRFEVGGDSDARDEVLRNLLASLGIIVALTIATIVLTFGSYRLALLSGVVAILSTGLSLLALAIFAYPFGIQGVIGVIGSIGVSINAAIIIITALQQDEHALSGDRSAIHRIVLAQSRHIISTTVTTFGGFLPLILEGGGFWPPFAMSIAGGVLLSTIVSFYFVPPAFALLARRGLPKKLNSGLPASDKKLIPTPA